MRFAIVMSLLLLGFGAVQAQENLAGKKFCLTVVSVSVSANDKTLESTLTTAVMDLLKRQLTLARIPFGLFNVLRTGIATLLFFVLGTWLFTIKHF